MDWDEIRDAVFEEHQLLRKILVRIAAMRTRLDAGDTAQAEPLRREARRLYECFSAHLAMEDTMLLPALRIRGREGRAAALVREHREQRELLRFLLRRLSQVGRPVRLLSSELTEFDRLLRDDMEEEERWLRAEDREKILPAGAIAPARPSPDPRRPRRTT